MAVGPFSNESRATDNRIIATDQAQAVRRGVIANPGGTAVGERGQLVLGTNLGKAKIKGDLNFVTEQPNSDPALVAALAALANRESSPSGPVTPPAAATPGATPAADANAPLGTRISDAVRNGLSTLTGFFKTTDASGATVWNKTALLFAAAIGGLILWRKFKR